MSTEAGKEQFLRALRERGGRAGNTALRRVLGWDEDEYWPVQKALVAEGRIKRGAGKGGSVALVESDASEVEESDPGKAAAKNQSGGRQSSPAPGTVAPYGSYQHDGEAPLRPDVGIQDQFGHARRPKIYRYDSSLAPELAWDENAEREFAEWLLNLIAEAAEHGEAEVFSEARRWRGSGERFESVRQCVARLQSLSGPFLDWAGKAERQQISVPTVPLFVHERHSTRAILEKLKSYKAAGQNLDLFGDPQVDVSDKLDAYEHTGPWTNRMILGDSLQVMNSLLEYEGLGGQVQMIYMDPPYGVKFGSNFQPFVRKRDVKHGRDEEMIREPEMVKAYRDTWELGLHSYLSYLRDRLLLARELLTESGSVFVQISNENLHHVREVMEEVFGAKNFCSQITFKKTTGAGSPSGGTTLIAETCDYLLWFCKDKDKIKFTQLYVRKMLGESGASQYTWKIGQDKSVIRCDPSDPDLDPKIVFAHDNLTSQSSGETTRFSFEHNGRGYSPGKGGWKTNREGMRNLQMADRLIGVGSTLRYKRYFLDFPYNKHNDLWTDTVISGFGAEKLYAVQTMPKVIERCIQMATEPGDLILDPTCGSGTTAYVAEKWGRRWITCDTSRVPLALARQRLLTATFPWYELKKPQLGPTGGFNYERKQNRKGEEVGGLVPRITLKSIANNEEPEMVTLVDRPEENRKVTRVCGPFTVEATIQAAATLDETVVEQGGTESVAQENPRAYLDRMIEVLRRAHTLRLPGNQALNLENVRPLADCEWLHAEAATADNGNSGQRAAVVFGPEEGAIHSQQVYEAAREAHYLKYDHLYLFGFAIQAKARELVEDRKKLRIPCTYVNVTPDVVMTDLLKTSHTDQIFSVTGLPDVQLKSAGKRDDGEPLYQTEVRGLDIFRPDSLETESIEAENLPCWMLDTDYNGMVFCASQVFFPRTGAWDNLKKSLKAEFNESVWEHLAGTESEPFVLGDQRRIAVKVIDERGNELMVVREAESTDE